MSPVSAAVCCPTNYVHDEVAGEPFFVFFDSDRKWLKCSEAFAAFLGYEVQELVGGTAQRLFPEGFEYNDSVWRQFLSEGQITRFMPLKKKSGQRCGVWATYTKLSDGCMVVVVKAL